MAKRSRQEKAKGTPERSIWRGNVSFGLVSIPVGLYRAEDDQDLHFTMLDKHGHAPIRYDRKNSRTGKALPWSDIVKGYPVGNGDYVILTAEDFARANVEATGGIDISDFVPADAIDPLYFVKPYYLLPQRGAEKTYVLLREALSKSGRVGVGKVVIRTRQHLALVRVIDNFLVLHLLRFSHELRDRRELQAPKKAAASLGVGPQELKMAQALIDSMASPWNPEQYKDTYHDDLLSLIAAKRRAGGKTPAAPAAAAAHHGGAKVVDIMDLLQRSVASRQGKAGRRKTKVAGKRQSAGKSQTEPKAKPKTEPEPKPKAKRQTLAATGRKPLKRVGRPKADADKTDRAVRRRR